MNSIDIKYLFHSGYSVEFLDKIFIFDYYKGGLSQYMKKDKDVYFFVSHGHKDHFNKLIFDYIDRPGTYYILSKDLLEVKKEGKILNIGESEEQIELKKKFFEDNVYLVDPGERLEFSDLYVNTYGSTDRGVSFYVRSMSLGIFHAGDLNLWIWDEDAEEEREEMYKDFMRETEAIALEKVDIAFFPLDPRLKERAEEGLKIFLDEVDPQLLFPMHQEDNYTYSISFYNKYKEYRDVFKPIYSKGQTFIVSLE